MIPSIHPPDLTTNSVVLVVGNGLTMVDAAYRLTRDSARAPRLVTVSRRGLLPRAQSEFHVAAVRGGSEFLERARTLRRLVASTRQLALDVESHGGDWREVITFIRNQAPTIWQHLGESDKRRFLRHVQSHWDVHRHRLPLRLAAHIDSLRQAGRLDIGAGRIERVPDGDRLRVAWRHRGTGCEEILLVDAVVNATGPDFALSRSRNPLLRSLCGDGLICADPLELGLVADPQLACVRRDGTAGRDLFSLGPMLRASYWESTAAAELRDHAERLAHHLGELGGESAK